MSMGLNFELLGAPSLEKKEPLGGRTADTQTDSRSFSSVWHWVRGLSLPESNQEHGHFTDTLGFSRKGNSAMSMKRMALPRGRF
jgi:hypothetical protein